MAGCNCDYSQLPITSQCRSCGYGPSVANPETIQKKYGIKSELQPLFTQ